MKRFKWPLQRLLDVTIQRERALRSELFRLSREMAQVHQEIFRRKTALRAGLAELAGQDIQQRIPRQEVFMNYSGAIQKALDELDAKLEDLTRQRRQTTERFMRTRSSRQTLERLLAEARQRHIRRQLKLEQKTLDESAHVSFARKAIQTRIARRT